MTHHKSQANYITLIVFSLKKKPKANNNIIVGHTIWSTDFLQ